MIQVSQLLRRAWLPVNDFGPRVQINLNHIADIIEGCKQQRRSAQRQLYEQYKGLALSVIFRYIYRYEVALDVSTDGFVNLFRAIGRFDTRVSREDTEKLFIGWMKRIMINAAIDQLRRKSMLPEVGALPEEVWDVPDNGPEADHALRYKDLILMVKMLPPQYRIVFNLYAVDGYSHQEISDMMGIPVGTSKSNLSRARTLLQTKLKQQADKRHVSGI